MNLQSILFCLTYVCFSIRTEAQQNSSDTSCYTLSGSDTLYKMTCPLIELPTYKGGPKKMNKFLLDELNYPPLARKLKLEGEVIIGFTVNKNGYVKDVKLVKGIHPPVVDNAELQKKYNEAAQLMNTVALVAVSDFPKWKPGKNRENRVDVYYTLPISFKLE